MADAEQVYRAHPTADEVAEVLAQRLVAAVGTLNADGPIHLAYVLLLHDDGRMYFETSSVTRKARNAERRGWAGSVLHEETRKELTGSYEDAWLTGDE
jgi:general stress protein 26